MSLIEVVYLSISNEIIFRNNRFFMVKILKRQILKILSRYVPCTMAIFKKKLHNPADNNIQPYHTIHLLPQCT